MFPQIDHPTDRSNFSIVRLSGVTLAYSYETIVGFQTPGHLWTVIENQWGPTTGKHLNWLDDDKTNRIPPDEFKARLRAALIPPKLRQPRRKSGLPRR